MPFGAYSAGHLEAVELGKTEVEHDQIHTAPQRPFEGLRTVGTDFDVVSLPPQSSGKRLGDGRVVLGEQY